MRAARRCINLGHCTPAARRAPRPAPTSPIGRVAQRAGVELRTHCRVREITTDEHGMAAGVVYYDADGKEQFQAAEVVIVACNGVGTPRLLLNSASARFPNGLANSSGLVGKNLMFHPYCQVYGYVDEATDSNRAPPTCLWSKEFYETDPIARLRARLHVSVRPRRRAGASRRSSARRRACCRGAPTITPSFGG